MSTRSLRAAQDTQIIDEIMHNHSNNNKDMIIENKDDKANP